MWLSARAWERTSRVCEFLQANKSRIKPLLEDEIALKYYLRRGGVESALRQDTQLHKALEQWDGTIPSVE